MVRVAILDDYQQRALTSADWSVLPEGARVTAFKDHLFEESAIAQRLQDFDVVIGIRERTPFRRSLLQPAHQRPVRAEKNAVALAALGDVFHQHHADIGCAEPWLLGDMDDGAPLFLFDLVKQRPRGRRLMQSVHASSLRRAFLGPEP